MFEQSTDVCASELRLFIGGIPLEWDEGDLRHFMQQFGSVEKVRINRDETSKPKGFGFATLSSHVAPALIYGKHYSHVHTIEIKQLLQKCLYLQLPAPESLSNEQIRAYFEKLPYPIDSVDSIFVSGSQNCFIKVCFTRDHNLKAIVDQRFLEIDAVQVEVTDHLEKQGKQSRHSQAAKPSNGKKKSQALATAARPDLGGFEYRDQARESQLQLVQQSDSASTSTFKSIVQAAEETSFPGAVIDSDFSSRSKRKLSFGRSKHIESFVPQPQEKPAPYAMSQSTPDFGQKVSMPFNPVVQQSFPLHQMNVWHPSLLQSQNYPNPLAASHPAIPLPGYSSHCGWPADVPVGKKEPTINFFTFPGRD